MAQRGRRTTLMVGVVTLGLLAACSSDSDGDRAAPEDGAERQATTDAEPVVDDSSDAAPATTGAETVSESSTQATESEADAATPAVAADCTPAPTDSATAWDDGESVEAEVIGETPDGLPVRAVVYPGPTDTGDPWSQWGQGAVTADGHFLSATGDHQGVDGNSYLYDFDPATGELTMIGDVLSMVDHQPGAWGYGKIHAQMVAGPCGEIYVTTYWGTRRDLVYEDGYEGDLMLRLDPAARTTSVLGVPVPGHGVPSLAAVPANGLVYGEATEPTSDPDAGTFFAYDVESGETTIVDDSPDHVGFRALAVDAEGRALFTKPAGRLSRYDPATGETEQLDDSLPGEFLRAATPPAPDGTIYGVTQDPDQFIAIRPDGTIDNLGAAPEYTASLAMEPDGSTVYFVPGAHGDSAAEGTPLYALDTATGDQRVVVKLNSMTEDALGISADGTYNLALDAVNRRLFIGFNGAAAGEDDEFGEVVLVEVTLPPADGSPASQPPDEPDTTDTTPSTDEPPDEQAAAADVVVVSDLDAVTCASWPAPDGSGNGGMQWDDATTESGLEDALVGMMGHAAAWGDLDGDGGSDLFVGTFADRPDDDYAVRGASGPGPDLVLRADDDGGWQETATEFELGRTSGSVFADLDLDGDADLVAARNVSNKSETPTVVMRNDGGELTLVDDSGLDPESPGRSIGVLEIDGDGLPDLIVLEDRFRGESSRIYRNLGDLRFGQFDDDAGWPDDVHGLGIGTGDLNGDGLTDVVVGGSNRVFVGTGDALREVDGAIEEWDIDGEEDDAAGVALGDVDNDGDTDVVIGQHFNSTIDGSSAGGEAPVRLYRNDTAGVGEDLELRDVTAEAGLIDLPTKAPHVALVDLDNDGRLDLLTTAAADDGDTPAVFMNTTEAGGEPSFAPPDGLGSDQYWVTGPTADVDHDGRLDVFLVEWYAELPSRLLLNRTPAGHALEVAVDESLGGGPGTIVAAYEPGGSGDPERLVARVEISPTQGYSGGVESVAHLGLGDVERVDMVVTPPAPHAPIELPAVPADRRLRLPTGC